MWSWIKEKSVGERERKRKRVIERIFHLQVHFLYGYNKQGLVQAKGRRTRSFIWSPTWVTGTQTPGLSSVTFPGMVTGSWIRGEAAKAWIGAHARCQLCRWCYVYYHTSPKHATGQSGDISWGNEDLEPFFFGEKNAVQGDMVSTILTWRTYAAAAESLL